MTWRLVGRLTHLTAAAQRRLWRLFIAGAVVLLLAAWSALAVFTHVAEKAYERAGRTYLEAAPMAAELMDLRGRRGRLDGLPPAAAARKAAAAVGIGPDRLRIAPGPGDPAGLHLHAAGLTLRELAELLRNLRLSAGLSTVSAALAPVPGDAERAELDLVLKR